MTPKEKAEKLIEKFSPLVTTWDCRNDEPMHSEDIIADAKQCALIAVEEVINSMTVATSVYLPFWQQVKTEIEKL